ncbi:hypothetical protein AB0F52_12385 [Amycolatopsis sp. NPDC024027]|uniref:hypothetical protein n=1 Tax=Amycolatopsis sp. NPDC024027 TaxID=3154327 RepID=UPI0033CC1DCE
MERENRPGREVDPALERAAKAAVKLRTRKGVRRTALHRDLGPDLRRVWHIADDAPPHRVRAIVFLRLSDVLATLGDPELEAIVSTAYNIRREPWRGRRATGWPACPASRRRPTTVGWNRSTNSSP